VVGTITVAALVLVGWDVVARRLGREYLLPAPGEVADALLVHRAEIGRATVVTVAEVGAGLLIGFSVAVVLGYLIAHLPLAERLIMPTVVASQAIPIVAVAPLLVLLFGGAGLRIKVAAAALIVFFPMLIATVLALRNIDPACRELMRVFAATRWQTLTKLEIPAALPVVMGGVRVGVTLAVIGAVVGEFVAPSEGLGSVLVVTRGTYQDAYVFAVLVVLIAMSLTLYGLAVVVERLVLGHRARSPIRTEV
jgi:NitT/TauT family transport system permease protein